MKKTFAETMKEIADRIGLDNMAANPRVIASALRDLGQDETDVALMRTVVNSAAAKPLMQQIIAMQGTPEDYRAQKELLMNSAFLGETPANKVLTGLWAMRGLDAEAVLGRMQGGAAQAEPAYSGADASPERSRRDEMRPAPAEIPRPKVQTTPVREVPRPQPQPQKPVEKRRHAQPEPQHAAADTAWGHGMLYKTVLFFCLTIVPVLFCIPVMPSALPEDVFMMRLAGFIIGGIVLLAVCRSRDRKMGRTWLKVGQLFAGSTISKVGGWRFATPILLFLLGVVMLWNWMGGGAAEENAVFPILAVAGLLGYAGTLLGYVDRAHQAVPRSDAQ